MSAVIQLGSGATEQDIVKALAQLTSGDTLVLPKDAVIKITSGIKVDVSARDITLDLNGSTLQQAGNVTVLNGYGAHVDASAVGLSKNAAGDAVISYDKTQSSLKVGDWIKVFADDGMPHGFQTGDTPTRLGQALQVKAIDGGKVTLDGALVYQDSYQTNIRASEYNSGQLVVRNGTVQGDQSHADWKSDLVQIRSTVDAKVEHLTVQNGNSMGINIVDSVDALVQDALVRNLKDDPANGYNGYGVHSASSTGTTVVGLYADKVRHATDDNAVGVSAGHPNPSKYGADIGMTVKDSVAYNTTSFAYGWHSEGVNGTVTDSLAFDSMGFVGGRGTGNSVSDSAGANLLKGILLYEYGDGDGRGLTFDNISLKEVRDYAYYTSGTPLNNLIKDSTFEVLNKATSIGTAGVLENVKVTQGKFVLNDLMVGTDASDKLLGGQGLDVILGGTGDDYIWGGAGADLLTGGSGHDRFAYHKLSEGGDTIADFSVSADVLDLSVLIAQQGWQGDPLAGSHVRLIQSGADTLLQAHTDASADSFVTLARLLGIQADALTASNIQTAISGSAQAAFGFPEAAPAPRAPVDNQVWQTGDTTYTLHDSATLGAAGLNLAYAGTGAFVGIGNDLANTLSGGAGADRLEGLGGDDVLDGKVGTDTLIGGLGNDTYVVDDIGDVVTELAGEGIDTVQTTLAAYTLDANVENLTFIGTSPFSAMGNELANVLTGGSGNDRLDGKGGADTLVGGAGNDTYVVDDADAAVMELAEQGVDTVQTTLATYTLDANVENLTFVGATNFNALGNALANVLTSGSGHDRLDGKAGADTLIGGLGNDTYVVDNIGDVVVELAGQGKDRVLSGVSYTLNDNVETLQLSTGQNLNGTGNALGNTVIGNAGANILDGRGGADILTGGAGNDIFVFRAGETQGDKVTDFSGAGTMVADQLAFHGFGAGATFTQAANSDLYTITADAAHGGASETFQIVGVTNLDLLTGLGHNDVLLVA